MVLINETKYACQSCIKGHRSSSCTHTDRPLFEIKKKGRPATQCTHCRELRKTKQVHVKCMCEAPSAPPTPLAAPVASTSSSSSRAAMDEPFSGGESSSSAAAAPPSQSKPKTKTKKKDVTLNPPIFPNGLKDYHEMAIAAEALSGLLGGPAVVVKNEKSSVNSLLNPCMCRAGGGCACCTDKKKPSKKADGPSPSSSSGAGGCCSSKSKQPNPVAPAPPLPPSRSTSNYSAYSSTNNSTENLAESSFQLKNPLPVSLRNYQPNSNPASGTNTPPTARPLPADELSHIHPAHTSRHVHKTQLYSPYRGGSNGHLPQGNLQPSRSASQSRRSSTAANAPPQQLAPMKSLTEQMCTFVRVQEQSLLRSNAGGSGDELDGVVATGEGGAGGANVMLPPFETFLRGGKDGEGGMMSGCMCGDGCACPNCVQHGNMEVDEEGGEAGEHKDCPPSCSSCFNCTSGFSLPKHVSNIEDLIAACASELPPPPVARLNSYALDATNVNVLPSSAWASKESKEAFGLLEVPKLECCSGRCQCPPGDCSCMKDCCGCCGGCDCEGEGDASKVVPQADQAPRDWTLPPQETSPNEEPNGEAPSKRSSCCSGKPPVAEAPPSDPAPPPPSTPAAARPPTASSSIPIQPSQKPSIYKKPAKSDHHRPMGSYEQQSVVKSLSRSNSTASKPHRPQLPKSVSQGVFGNGEILSPTTNVSPIEFQGGNFRRDRSGSSASRSSYQPSPSRSGAATPVSQVSSPHLRPQNHPSDFASLREDNLRQSPFYPPPPQQPSSSSSSIHHANEELFQLQHNPNLSSLLSNSDPSESHEQFRSYEEFVAASHLHQHTLMQEQQRLQEEQEEKEQERRRQQQQHEHEHQQQQQQQQGPSSQALEMFLLDEEMEAQLNALLAGGNDASNTAGSSTTDFSLGLEAPSANVSSSSHLQSQPLQQQHHYHPQQQPHQSNEDFISAFQPNFDFDPPSPRRGQREFSPMQFDEATGTFGGDFGVGQDQGGGGYDGTSNFPANAADFLLSNFAAPTPAAHEVEEPHVDDHQADSQRGPEDIVSPDTFGGLEFDPVSFLQDALGLDASTTDPNLQEGSSGSSSGDTNGGGTLVDPLFDPFDTGDFDFNSFTKDSSRNWFPDQSSI